MTPSYADVINGSPLRMNAYTLISVVLYPPHLIRANEPLEERLALVGEHEADFVGVDEEAGHGLALQLDAVHQGRVHRQGEHLRRSGVQGSFSHVIMPSRGNLSLPAAKPS